MHLFVFDVESVGLYGEGFAVAFTVQDSDGNEVESGYIGCPIGSAEGGEEDRKWVKANVCPHLPEVTHHSPRAVRYWFWQKLQEWRNEPGGCLFFAECGYPVESSFLAACVQDASIIDPNAKWKAPYPLHDIASIMFAAGMDPMATYERGPNELPAHNPLADARLSARLLREAMSPAQVQEAPAGIAEVRGE